MKLREYATSFS